MLIKTAFLFILKSAVHFTITLIIVNVYVLGICKSLLIKRIITQGPACEAYETLRLMYIIIYSNFTIQCFVKYVTLNVILLLMHCSTILIYFIPLCMSSSSSTTAFAFWSISIYSCSQLMATIFYWMFMIMFATWMLQLQFIYLHNQASGPYTYIYIQHYNLHLNMKHEVKD
jgi:hypothetical protein